MLSKEDFDQWCWWLGLSDQAQAVITHIRTSLPAHRVRSSAGNVSGACPSLKMGFAIQFENHFLGDYLRKSPPLVPPDIAMAIRTTVMRQPGICLSNLIATLHRGNANAVYQLILIAKAYCSLSRATCHFA